MPAFEISQAGNAAAESGSRSDLWPRLAITLTAVDPAPGPGVSYTWEILDKVGSAAALDTTSGTVVNIGVGGSDINDFCGFKVKLTANDNGDVTEVTRIAAVGHPVTRRATLGSEDAAELLGPPMFSETADPAGTFTTHDADSSTDNQTRADIAGSGLNERNWRGWSTADFLTRKHALMSAFMSGWENEINSLDSLVVPPYGTIPVDGPVVDVFSLQLSTLHRFFPQKMWGLNHSFDVDFMGVSELGFPVNFSCRIQYNTLMAAVDEVDPAPSINIYYTLYDCPAAVSIPSPTTVRSPDPATGPDSFYLTDVPDGPYVLPSIHAPTPSDWWIDLQLVVPTDTDVNTEDAYLARYRVKPVLSVLDVLGEVNPDVTI